MILTLIMNIVVSIIWHLIVFQFGCILTESKQLRRFLGLRIDEEQEHRYAYVTRAIELIGKLLTFYAIINVFASIIGILVAFSNMSEY